MIQKCNISAEIVNIKSLQSSYIFKNITHAVPKVFDFELSFRHVLCIGLRQSETSWTAPMTPCVYACLHYMS
jgi:hypothetical protein